jgi:hypothetical protein
MQADTDTDMETHRVLIDSISIVKMHFPSLDEDKSKKMEDVVRKFFTPNRSLVMSVEQVSGMHTKKRQHKNSYSE